MRSTTRFRSTAALLAAGWLVACEQPPTAPAGVPDSQLGAAAAPHAHHGPATSVVVAPPDLARMRAGTARYQQFAEARADGFVPLSECVAAPWGGMGYHFGHPDRLQSLTLDPALPQVLLYEPMKNGRMRLVGVEFMIHGEAWYAAGNTSAPALAGRTFDPPNPDHPDEDVRPFYTLHVWAWRENPDGVFAPFNPNVSCAHAGH